MHFSSFILPLLFPSNTHRSGPYSGAAWSPHWNARRETWSGSHLQEEMRVCQQGAGSPSSCWRKRQLESATPTPVSPVLSLRHFLCPTMNSGWKYPFLSISKNTPELFPGSHSDQFINGTKFNNGTVTLRLWQLLLTFPRHLHDDAASWGPQVHSAAACAHSQAGLAGVPLEILDGAQLLQHHWQLQLPDVPDPHSVGNVICRRSSNTESWRIKGSRLVFLDA